jgi:hypothetical protein
LSAQHVASLSIAGVLPNGERLPIEVAPIYPKLTDIRGIDKAEGGALVYEDGSQFPLEEYQSGLDGGKQ